MLDGRFRYPFTWVVSGQSWSLKSIFVRNVLLKQKDLIDTEFDYVYIFLGTSVPENKTLSMIGVELCQRVNALDVRDKYLSKEVLKENFPWDLNSILRKHSAEQKKGCLIFDDLTEELSQCGILSKLFTKCSTNYDVSIINITQNLFHQSAQKSEHTTMYRNTCINVIFNNPIDNSVLTVVAKRLRPSGYSPLIKMLNYIVENYRYVVTNADLEWVSQLKFTTDIFATKPLRHQTVFMLKEDSSDEEDWNRCLRDMYSTRVTKLRKKDWTVVFNYDVYIGPALYNSHWDLKQSMWCNPYQIRKAGRVKEWLECNK